MNGRVTKSFTPERGLRQGYPLSPYLFILCSEWLSLRITKSLNDKTLSGVKVCHQAPPISHLFFADDSLLFFKASASSTQEIKCILSTYERIYGQKVNYNKSEICLSRNISIQDRILLSSSLNVKIVQKHNSYLRLPFFCGRNKREITNTIIDKIQRMISNWSNKVLSIAGKEILINAVLQALPVYTMSCFLIPESAISKIHSTILQFWWGAETGHMKVHWVRKEVLYRRKEDGGLGLRDLHAFNLALLAKECWRILEHPSSLLAHILKKKIFPPM